MDKAQEHPIRVKLLSKIPTCWWLHQLPTYNPALGGCHFIFDPEARDYDWLVVYDDLSAQHPQEVLGCAPEHTLLVTAEPSSIKMYGNAYARQFGCVLTSQASWALPHPDRIYSQPALMWFYGIGANHVIPFEEIEASPPAAKSMDLAMVFSPKSMRHTLHRRRFDFMREIMRRMPEMDVYGRDARPLDDKAEALCAYRYHIAIENFAGPHHWTEKLADAYLGLTLPFYYGCPNAADYFPPESFIPIDIRDPEAAVRTIRRAIADHEYEKRLPAIQEARRRVLREYNLFAVIAREIHKRHASERPRGGQEALYSRHALRRRGLGYALGDLYGKVRGRLISLARGD